MAARLPTWQQERAPKAMPQRGAHGVSTFWHGLSNDGCWAWVSYFPATLLCRQVRCVLPSRVCSSAYSVHRSFIVEGFSRSRCCIACKDPAEATESSSLKFFGNVKSLADQRAGSDQAFPRQGAVDRRLTRVGTKTCASPMLSRSAASSRCSRLRNAAAAICSRGTATVVKPG